MQEIAWARSTIGEPGCPHHRVGGYQEYAPPPDLADAVVSLCFMGTRAADGSAGASRLRLIGPIAAAKMFAPGPRYSMASIRVKLEWCRPLLGATPGEHAGGEPCYADIRPDLAAPLEEELMRTTEPADALRLLAAFLSARRARLRTRTVVSGVVLLRVGMESLRRGAS